MENINNINNRVIYIAVEIFRHNDFRLSRCCLLNSPFSMKHGNHRILEIRLASFDANVYSENSSRVSLSVQKYSHQKTVFVMSITG